MLESRPERIRTPRSPDRNHSRPAGSPGGGEGRSTDRAFSPRQDPACHSTTVPLHTRPSRDPMYHRPPRRTVPRHHRLPGRSGWRPVRARATASYSTSRSPRSRRIGEASDPNCQLLALGHVSTTMARTSSLRTNGAAASRPMPRSDPRIGGRTRSSISADTRAHFDGYYKLPAAQSEVENCVAHNGSLVPVPGRDIWCRRGTRAGFRSMISPILRIRRRSLFRSWPARRQPSHYWRYWSDVLVRWPHLRIRDRAWARHL